jgi:hypothetical protein
MGVIYEIDGANESVLAYAARHDSYNPVARDHDREHLHLLLRTARELIAGTITLSTEQRLALVASLDEQIAAEGI